VPAKGREKSTLGLSTVPPHFKSCWIKMGTSWTGTPAKEQACIIVANHQSLLDILGMFDIWSVMDKCTVVAKK